MVDTISNVTDAILENPQLWMKPEFDRLREFAYKTMGAPDLFPPPPNIKTTPTSTSTNIQLSKGFISSVYSRQVQNRSSFSMNPIVLIGNISAEHKSARLVDIGSKMESVKKITFHAIDGDNDVIVIKLSTQLNNMSSLLYEGVCIELLNFQTLIYTHGDGKRQTGEYYYKYTCNNFILIDCKNRFIIR